MSASKLYEMWTVQLVQTSMSYVLFYLDGQTALM
jgi:hypothetical protein